MKEHQTDKPNTFELEKILKELSKEASKLEEAGYKVEIEIPYTRYQALDKKIKVSVYKPTYFEV